MSRSAFLRQVIEDRLGAHCRPEDAGGHDLLHLAELGLRKNLQLLKIRDRLDRVVALLFGFAELLGQAVVDPLASRLSLMGCEIALGAGKSLVTAGGVLRSADQCLLGLAVYSVFELLLPIGIDRLAFCAMVAFGT